jgi:DNA phosphorothioation-associated DGQHR protein 1
MKMSNFKEILAIKVHQPLGDFYMAKFFAKDLLQLAFSEELQYIDEKGHLKGSQRKTDEKRLKEIARYIDSVEMSFPNSIILAANYDESGKLIDDENERWRVKEIGENSYKVIIPTSKRLAAIIDGQHRLKAFKYIDKKEREEIEIPCSIFFDLPNSYQAFLFATINGNQKKVDKSLALEQFGFNVEDEPQKSWTPEKLAVYFSRRLNLNETSPFFHRIKVAPKDDNILFKGMPDKDWVISTATIVDGIIGLISSNPKRDRVEMGQEHIFGGRNRKLLKDIRDSSPLRSLFIQNEDEKTYQIIIDYFDSVNEILWSNINTNSYLVKTVGIQALFDFLKKVLQSVDINLKVSFLPYLEKITGVNFSDYYFQASGVGRARIRNIFLYANGFIKEIDLKEADIREIERLIAS